MALFTALARSIPFSHYPLAAVAHIANKDKGASNPFTLARRLTHRSTPGPVSEEATPQQKAADSKDGPHHGSTKEAFNSSSSPSAEIKALSTAAGASAAAGADSAGRSYVPAEVLTEISSTLNRLTGYESIDMLKGSVVTADKQLQHCKRQLQLAKLEYEQQLAKQTQLHREVTALLQRKSSWVPADVARFTELYAAEHETEQAVAAAKAKYSGLSDDAERLQLQLVDLIRERYQQEQLWSDKIRRASTWWTWGLMGLHFASFVTVYTFLEPRKRAALQAAIADMLQQHAGAVDAKLMSLSPTAATETDTADAPGQQVKGQQQQQVVASKQSQQKHGSKQVPSEGDLHDFQHHIVQELQLLRQQMSTLQQVIPPAAAAAPAVQQQQQHHWHIPGSRWAAQQWTAATRSLKSLWSSSRQRLQQVAVRLSNQQSPQQQQVAQEGVAGSSSSSSSSTSSITNDVAEGDTVGHAAAPRQAQPATHDRHDQPGTTSAAEQSTAVQHQPAAKQQRAVGQEQPMAKQGGTDAVRPITEQASTARRAAIEQQGAAAQPLSSSRGLLQQWQAGDKVLEVTRSQIATLAAGASALGAALAAGLLILLKSSRGPGSSS